MPSNVIRRARESEPKGEELFANSLQNAMHVVNDYTIYDVEGWQNVKS